MSRYPFVGREWETAHVRGELEAERSVVLTGISGIGRTSLAHHVAEVMAHEWRFVFAEFDRGPEDVWRDLFAAIFPKAQARLRGEGESAKWTRFRVSNGKPEDPRRHVVVLDNVAKLSAPSLGVLRRLRKSYQVLAIVEAFLPETAKAALCSALWARPPLHLEHLGQAATVRFFEECSRRHGWEWGHGEIRGLASATAGFPLGMKEAVAAEVRRNEVVGRHIRLPPTIR